MVNKSIPPYKLPAEIQELIDKKTKRRRNTFLPKRNWVQNNPRLFQVGIITFSLLIFFSKPLYDGFFAPKLKVDHLEFDEKSDI